MPEEGSEKMAADEMEGGRSGGDLARCAGLFGGCAKAPREGEGALLAGRVVGWPREDDQVGRHVVAAQEGM